MKTVAGGPSERGVRVAPGAPTLAVWMARPEEFAAAAAFLASDRASCITGVYAAGHGGSIRDVF